jgi:hypothetical protein
MTSKTKESWRVEAFTLIKFQKVFIFFIGPYLIFNVPKGSDQLLEHAVNMDAFNARSTSSGNSLPSQVAQDLQLFRRSLEERDVCCIMTAFPEYTASHIIPYAHENAVSQHPK